MRSVVDQDVCATQDEARAQYRGMMIISRAEAGLCLRPSGDDRGCEVCQFDSRQNAAPAIGTNWGEAALHLFACACRWQSRMQFAYVDESLRPLVLFFVYTSIFPCV